jgi:hypothetical protein
MRPPGMLVMALALATVACSKPFPCTRYCWSHKQYVPDLTGEDMPGVPDGRFDMQCDGLLIPSFGTHRSHPPDGTASSCASRLATIRASPRS